MSIPQKCESEEDGEERGVGKRGIGGVGGGVRGGVGGGREKKREVGKEAGLDPGGSGGSNPPFSY